ncbi:MAG: hypothetical protein HYS45_03430 [Parcubacteria group bacterium]|nr:hypothetical protein [Parcubacteria group bacterium]
MDASVNALVNRRNKLLFRIPLLVTGLVALFWGIWYLAAGSVPSVSSITLGEETAYQLPFALSRLLDIPAAAVFAVLAVLVWYFGEKGDDSAVADFPVVVAAATAFSLAVGVPLAAAIAVGVSLGVGLGVGIAIVAVAEKKEYRAGIAVCTFANTLLALGFGAGIALEYGGVAGLVLVVALAAANTLLSALVFSAVVCGVKVAVRRRSAIAKGVADWVTARD